MYTNVVEKGTPFDNAHSNVTALLECTNVNGVILLQSFDI